MNNPPKLEQPETKTIECAFFHTEHSGEWFATVTWKCPVCGRRNRVRTKGPGKLMDSVPIKVKCKLGHETPVKPYRT
jgi:hypothetical protein